MKPEILRFDSSSIGNGKRSTHLVVCNYLMGTSSDCMTLARLVHAYIPGEYRQYVDLGVYKSVQNFRIEGSSKAGEHRPKTRVCGSPEFHGLIAGLITSQVSASLVPCSVTSNMRRLADPGPSYTLSYHPSDVDDDDEDF
jgi:hypothetical protein